MSRRTVLLSYSSSNKWSSYQARAHPGLNSIFLGMTTYTRKSCEFLPCLTVILMLFFLASFAVTTVWQGLPNYAHLQWAAIGLWIVTAMLLLLASGIKYMNESGFLRRKLGRHLFTNGDRFVVIKASEGNNQKSELDDSVFYPTINERKQKQPKKITSSPTLYEETISLDRIKLKGDFTGITKNKLKHCQTTQLSGNAYGKSEGSRVFDKSRPSTSRLSADLLQNHSSEKLKKENITDYNERTAITKKGCYHDVRWNRNQVNSQTFVLEI